MGQTFAYEGKIAEGVSLAGGILTQLYSGIDGPSAVVVGVEVGAGAFGRATAGRRFGPVRAALTLDATYGPRFGILVLQAIEAALDPGASDGSVNGSAFSEENAWTLKPGFAVAWAPHRALGLTLSSDYQWVSLDTEGSNDRNEAGVDVAVAADLDFGRITRVPVALVAAWHTTQPLGSDGVTRVIDYSGGAYYTGRPALVLGLEVGWRSFTVRDLATDATIAQIRLQYHW
jgi:hypothetical protein